MQRILWHDSERNKITGLVHLTGVAAPYVEAAAKLALVHVLGVPKLLVHIVAL
jgi:hypothetical protein